MSDDSRFTEEAFELVTDKDKIEELKQKANKPSTNVSESKLDNKKIS